MMSRGWLVGLPLILFACGAFGTENPPGGQATPGDGKDGGGSDGPGSISGEGPAIGVTVNGAVRLTQGASTKFTVNVQRKDVEGTIHVTIGKLPAGISAKNIDLPENSQGEIELSATSDAKQGDITGLVVTAKYPDGREATTLLPLFVRGAPGRADTTFATNGVNVFGPSGRMAVAQSDKHVVVAVDNGSLGTSTVRRLDPSGNADNKGFSIIGTSGAIYAVALAKDESIFAFVNHSLTHYLADGTLDLAYGTNGRAEDVDTFYVNSLAVADNFSVLLFGTFLASATTRSTKFAPNGTLAPDYTEAQWTHPGQTKALAFFALPQSDGTFAAAVGTKAAVSLIQLAGSGPVISYADAPQVGGPLAKPLGMKVGSNGTFVLMGGADASEGLVPTRLEVAHFGPNGALDTAFGDGVAAPGTAFGPAPLMSGSAALAVDGNGQPVVATITSVGGNRVMGLARLTSAGKPDTAVSKDGFVATDVQADYVFAVTSADSERVLLFGTHDGNGFVARCWL